PAVFTARAKGPSTVLARVTLPAPVEVRAVLLVRVTAPLYDCAPVVVTEGPLRSVVPAGLVASEVSGVTPPTAPSKASVPLPVKDRLWPPSTVVPNVKEVLFSANWVSTPRVAAPFSWTTGGWPTSRALVSIWIGWS